MKKFQLKYCGITSYKDFSTSVNLGVDYLGFNLFPKSPRYIDLESIKNLFQIFEIRNPSKPKKPKIVAVVVDPDRFLVESLIESRIFDIIQFHGNESVDFLVQFKNRIKLWKALKVNQKNLEKKVKEYSQICEKILLDMPKKADYSGPLKNFEDFEVYHKLTQNGYSLILAGGISPENLKDILQKLEPEIIDIASGIELNLGKKDLTKMKTCITIRDNYNLTKQKLL